MLKPRNTAVNVITAILAAMMSVLLVVLLFATALIGTFNGMLTPQGLGNTISRALDNVDFEQVILNSAGDMDIPEESLHEVQIVERLLDTDAAEEIIDLFSADITATLTGVESNKLTDTSLRKIVHDNVDEILDIICEIDPAIDREITRKELLNYVDENASDLIASLKSGITETTESMAEVTTAIEMLKTVFIVLLVAVILLAGGIYGCRWYRFGGFLWVGIDAAVAGVLTLLTSLLIKSDLFMSLMEGQMDDTGIINAVMAGVGSRFTITAIVVLGIGVLFIGLFILLKCTVVNPKIKAAKAAQEAPVADLPVAEAPTTTEG